jgi:hypothetical protein
MIEQAITITDKEIVLLAQFFIHKDYSVTKKDVILDVLANYYRGQQIRIRMLDGENFDFSGFRDFMVEVCAMLDIPTYSVIIETHGDCNTGLFELEQLKLGIFLSAGQHVTKDFDRDVSRAKFVGSLLGRYNISRLRLAYELDRVFPGDTFITYQPRPEFIKQDLRNFSDLYQKEFAWMETKVFDRDLISSHHMGMIDWTTSCASYGNVWNKYQIEVVSETDAISNFWFTEKTANCLATGKPFVLINGQGSLRRLRDMGFITFESVLDETYDNERNPYDRILHLTSSLESLYNSPSKDSMIQELYRLANQNIELYRQYCVRQ